MIILSYYKVSNIFIMVLISNGCLSFNSWRIVHIMRCNFISRNESTESINSTIRQPNRKKYILPMFPYPSGNLHMGHARVYTISDVLARYWRFIGYDVLHPIGWDSFGLPAENAAIERNIDPGLWTVRNAIDMKQQLKRLNISFDWSSEIFTSSKNYYIWTQWLFLKLYQNDLIYKKESFVNWDPIDKTVLANEQVDSKGISWRSGAIIEKRKLAQWFVKITKYQDKLYDGIENLDWPRSVKKMQKEWIGKIKGAFFTIPILPQDAYISDPSELNVDNGIKTIEIFTEYSACIYGVSFIAIDRNHYLSNSNDETILTSYYAINPLTNKKIPIIISEDSVKPYGDGAIFGIPSIYSLHKKIAQEYNLEVTSVLDDDEILINSGELTGMSIENANAYLSQFNFCKPGFKFKLRDWLISRQRKWGCPIPLYNCEFCQNSTPMSFPLTSETNDFITCPNCNSGKAFREKDTLDTFFDSSFYYLRYVDINNSKNICDFNMAKHWLPVDIYIGGIEHAIMHLLYARFIAHFLFDINVLPIFEPFNKLLAQGMITSKAYRITHNKRYLRPNVVSFNDSGVLQYQGQAVEIVWEKMSKSKYNGIDPIEMIDKYGVDVLRLYLLFKSPPDREIQWDERSILGITRWVGRVTKIFTNHREKICAKSNSQPLLSKNQILEFRSLLLNAVECFSSAMDHKYNFHVAIANLMKITNFIAQNQETLYGTVECVSALKALCSLLYPMAPILSKKLWNILHLGQASQDQIKWPSLNDFNWLE